MVKSGSTLNYGGIGDDSVKAKTGKSWSEWIKLLDKEKASKLSHKEIAVLVSEKYGIGDWWSQMVTVGYEQAKGLRQKNETASGFSASVSKVFNVPVSTVYLWWSDELKRKKWLNLKIVIHKASKNKSMRITMPGGSKSVSVGFYAKGDDKSQVVLQQEKLKDAKAVVTAKEFWKKSFSDLQRSMEI